VIRKRIAETLLVLACIHEFAWKMFSEDIQGDIRALTQWPLLVALCAFVAWLSKSRMITAACVAISIMSSTTAMCSAAWLYSPWSIESWEQSCSETWGFPMLLLSCFAAILVLYVCNTSDKNG
jgi:hypothetical protein